MPAVAAGARYWSDEAYSKFYGGSEAEQGLVNRPACGSAESLSSRQLDDFQAAFAEWSAGAGQLRAPDFRRFLLQLGLDLSPAQARALWAHAAPPDAREAAPPPHLGHAQVLELYRQVLENPLEFKTGLRACPPGKAPPPQEAPCAPPPGLARPTLDHAVECGSPGP
ncbi:unnamed protein product [Prorocentrum cordatum]|uniref:EH domain-containing protein n=1 Tax=Prorocentrum cordatum TaxID=2364126 RepID=A0ABN9V2Y0_9DINO|nr:unnamed protein product [Polarella glacialis]